MIADVMHFSSLAPFLARVMTERPELHIPDGFLNLPISLVSWTITIALLAIAGRRTQGKLSDRQIPLMGIMAAFIFAAQMINFPVAGGTSGHLLGGALAAIALGPWAGMLVMASVVSVQALLFQDGGIVVMGANMLNMGLLTALIGYGLYRGAASRPRKVRLIVAGVAAWLSVMAGALATSLQLWLSGTARLDIIVPAMMSVHALIGIGEALITVTALSFILRTRPDLLGKAGAGPRGGRGWVIAALITVLAVVLISPLASANPDGLERVATDLGFMDQSSSAPYQVLPDYTIPFLETAPVSTILAGAIGVLVVAVATVVVARLVRKSPNRTREVHRSTS